MERFEHTARTRQLHCQLSELRLDFNTFVHPRFFGQRPSANERITYLREIADVRSRLVEEISRVYPVLRTVDEFTISDGCILIMRNEPIG